MALAKSASARVSNRKSSVPTSAKRSTTANSTPSELALDLSLLSGLNNVYYEVDVETDDHYPHDDCDGTCRCRRIESARVRDVNHASIAQRFFFRKPKKDVNPFMVYAIERILRAYYRPNTFDDFHIDWGNSYYGQEVNSVRMPVTPGLREVFARLTAPYPKRMAVSARPQYLADRCIREALIAEYGHVLHHLEGKTWTIEKVSRGHVRIPGQFQPLDRKVIESYRHHYLREKTPQGIAIASGVDCSLSERFELIDGRHRFAAGESEKKIQLIVGR